MLARSGDKATVKVLDFGLARATREQKVDTSLTSEGQALGTPDFIAPEQILDAASADIRADVYSLGGTLFYLLTGRPPFEGNSAYDVYQGHISRDAGPLNLIRPEVPVEPAAVVAKMLAKEPGRRFQTPGEVAEALKPFFKKGNEAFKEPREVASPTDQWAVGEPVREEVSAPLRPGTDAESPAGPTRKAVQPTAAEVRWESLIEIKDADRSTEAELVAAPARRIPRRLRPVASASSLLGLVALGVIIITIRGKDGETKITLRDDSYTKAEILDVTVEHYPRVTSGPPNIPANTPGTPSADEPLNAKPAALPGPRAGSEAEKRGASSAGGTDDSRSSKVDRPAEGKKDVSLALPEATNDGFVPLFNGVDLAGWDARMGPRDGWRVEGRDLVVTGPGDYRKAGFLLTSREYHGFSLRFEFQMAPGANANSGVTFWAAPGDEVGGLAFSPQIEIRSKDSAELRNGSFFWSASLRELDTLPPDRQAVLHPAGCWNTAELEIRTGEMRFAVNGQLLLRADLQELAKRPEALPALRRRSGRIGFQSHTGTLRFRKIYIKDLSPSSRAVAVSPRQARREGRWTRGGQGVRVAVQRQRFGRVEETAA